MSTPSEAVHTTARAVSDADQNATTGVPRVRDLNIFPPSLVGKRILLCTESFGPVNGVSRTTLMLVNHLRDQGARVAVVAPHNHTRKDVFVPSHKGEEGQIEVRIHGYPVPFNPELSIVYPVRLSKLVEMTFGHDSPPDLIYLASPASLGFQVMLQLRQQPRERQIPILCSFQTDLAGYCAILFPPPMSDLAVYTFAAVQRFLFRHRSVKTVFYPSRFVRRYLEEQNVQAEKLEVLARGVKTETFCPSRRSEALRRQIAPNGEIILICVSRVAGEKGFDFLARAAKELYARGLPFKLYIVGGNRNAAVEQEVHEMFDPLREKGVVHFAGFQTGDTLAMSYASGDIFLHCSVTETFGLVVLESLASGVPVVARDEGGPSDIIHHGECGYLVPPSDLDGFVDRVIQLANDEPLRKRMSEQGRRTACEATWEKINNKVAWRMSEAIEDRQEELAKFEREEGAAASGTRSIVSTELLGLPLAMGPRLFRAAKARVVDARLAGGLGIIFSFWILVGTYVAFTEVVHWFRARTAGMYDARRKMVLG